MAERRFVQGDQSKNARRTYVWLGSKPDTSAWVVRNADGAVLQPFYAALDADRRLCWTDDGSRAELFETKQAAERFAMDRVTGAVCVGPAY